VTAAQSQHATPTRAGSGQKKQGLAALYR